MVLDVGAQTVTITNSGPLGSGATNGTQTVKISGVGGSQKLKIWFSIAPFPERGSEVACPGACAYTINLEYGQVNYWYEITDSSGNPLSPRQLSSKLPLAFVQQPLITSPFTVPLSVHGTAGYQTSWQFNVPSGTDVSQARIWMWLSNLRENSFAVSVNAKAYIPVAQQRVIGLSCDGTRCTFTFQTAHGLSANQVIQVNGCDLVNGNSPPLCGPFTQTVSTVPSSTTITVLSSLSAGTYNNGDNYDHGLTVSATSFCADETRWYGCVNDTTFQATQIIVPLGATDLTANANNALNFKLLAGVNAGGHHGPRVLDAEIVQQDFESDQCIVTGANVVCRTTAAHPFQVGDTLLLRDFKGPRWRFNGKRVVTAVADNTHFQFVWGPDITGEVAGVAPFTTANGTYVPDTSSDTTTVPNPHWYVARAIIPYANYQYLNPASYATYGGNSITGQNIWQNVASAGVLKDLNDYMPNHASLGSCATCHTKSGSDLKFFNFDPYDILLAAILRGRSETDGKDIAAFIANNSIGSGGVHARPWEPPYQPCPGQDSQTLLVWTAGCGLEFVLPYCTDMKEWMVPGGSRAGWAPGSSLNLRELPTCLQYDHWMRWLPETSPFDYFNLTLGTSFSSYSLWTNYQTHLSMTPNNYASFNTNGFVNDLTTTMIGAYHTSYSPDRMTVPGSTTATSAAAYVAPAQYNGMYYAVDKWVLSRTWELSVEFQTQNFLDQASNSVHGGPNARAAAQYTRGWYAEIPFNFGPHRAAGAGSTWWMNNSPIGNSIRQWHLQTARWYYEAMSLGAGDRVAGSSGPGYPIDWAYQTTFMSPLSYWRPALNLQLLPTIVVAQEAYGINRPDQDNSGGSCLNSGCISLQSLMSKGVAVPGIGAQQNYSYYFTSSTDYQADWQALADNYVTFVNAFTTAQWQAIFVGSGSVYGSTHCQSTDITSPGNTPAHLGFLSPGFCFADDLAYFLPMAQLFGVSSSTRASLVTWGNTIFPPASTGHNFATDNNNVVTAVTNANPAQLTVTGHALNNGDSVLISGFTGGCAGMNGTWTVSNVAANTFTIPTMGCVSISGSPLAGSTCTWSPTAATLRPSCTNF